MDRVHPEGPEVTWTAGVSDEDSIPSRAGRICPSAGWRRLDVGPHDRGTDLRRDTRGWRDLKRTAGSARAVDGQCMAEHRRRHLCVCGAGPAARDADCERRVRCQKRSARVARLHGSSAESPTMPEKRLSDHLHTKRRSARPSTSPTTSSSSSSSRPTTTTRSRRPRAHRLAGCPGSTRSWTTRRCRGTCAGRRTSGRRRARCVLTRRAHCRPPPFSCKAVEDSPCVLSITKCAPASAPRQRARPPRPPTSRIRRAADEGPHIVSGTAARARLTGA